MLNKAQRIFHKTASSLIQDWHTIIKKL